MPFVNQFLHLPRNDFQTQFQLPTGTTHVNSFIGHCFCRCEKRDIVHDLLLNWGKIGEGGGLVRCGGVGVVGGGGVVVGGTSWSWSGILAGREREVRSRVKEMKVEGRKRNKREVHLSSYTNEHKLPQSHGT